MAVIVGADTASPVTNALIAKAAEVMGQAPAFWGRYFTNIRTTDFIEYHHAVESPILAAAGIPVLPIARQTNEVGGAGTTGFGDGSANATDLIATFGADLLARQLGVCIFLDVEGSAGSHLSAEYYAGWAAGLASVNKQVRFLPCVYGLPGDASTWTALTRALANGSTCHGLWISHPNPSLVEPVTWNAAVKPSPEPGVPVLLWQYMFPRDGAAIDRNQVNPSVDVQNDILRYLVLPSAPTAVAGRSRAE